MIFRHVMPDSSETCHSMNIQVTRFLFQTWADICCLKIKAMIGSDIGSHRNHLLTLYINTFFH